MTLRNASRRWLVPLGLALLLGGLIVTSPVSVAAVNTLHVTDCGDAGANTLRGQIAASGAGDTIVFDQNCTITLTTGTLPLSHTVTINGTGHTVIVDGGCTLTNGVCTSGGVTVFAVLGVVTANLTALTIQHGNGSNGGGIYNNGGTLTVTNSILSGNSTTGIGGGISNNSGTVTVTGSTLSGNSADTGGGIYNLSGFLTVTTSTLSANTASGTSGGGGIYNLDILLVQSSTLSGNSASGGGGIYSNGRSAIVRNSTLSGNTANQGGGIANFGLGLLVQSSTLSGNSASSSGGGVYNCPCATQMSLNNTIVAGNTAGTLPDVDGTGAVNFHDLIGGTPLIGAFGNYGGPMQTFPLLPGSPAIDAGDDTTCAQAGSTDQRGIARPQGAHCDIGAFESQGFALAKTSGDNQSAIANGLFATPLAVAVTSSHGEPVAGGQVTFTAPGSGPSATLSSATVTLAGGAARVTATANGTVGGPYVVTVSAGGPSVATYSLTNLAAPPNTTYTVGTTADHAGVQTTATTCMAAANSTCALRDALTYATSGTDTIVFNGTGHGTITLTNGPLTLAAAITGPGANLLIIDGGCTGCDDPHGQPSGGVTVFVVNSGVTASISGLTIQHGNASVPDPADDNRLSGGGIANFGGSVTVTNSTLRNNAASDYGGGIYTNGGQVVVQSSTLSANQAEASGAIANRFSAGVVTVTNSTITGNFSIFAGGMINTFGTLTVTNSTITGNSSQFSGGGIVNSGGTVTVTNTIVAGNAGGDVTGAYTGSHNLIGGTPLLGTLGSYGGPTPTIPLLPGSPAIDAGDDAVCAQTGTGKVNGVDQRGITRPQGAHCDIGAFEALPPPNPLPPAKPPGPAAGAPSPLPGSRPAGTTGGPAPNPLPVARP